MYYVRYTNDVQGGIVDNKINLITVDVAYKIPEAVMGTKKFAVQDKADTIPIDFRIDNGTLFL
jgi:branched-chain amino acid transport system substrate-binding protein